jgi:NTE family protein
MEIALGVPRRLRVWGGALVLLAIVSQVAAPAAPLRRPRIGLALSGGAARGSAHVGILKELEAMHVPIDCIAGTSMGAVVGGLYASGMTPDEIERALSGVNWKQALSDQTARQNLTYRRKQDDQALGIHARVGVRGRKIGLPLGFLQGQKLELLLRRLTFPAAGVTDFEKLSTPFHAVAADLETGEAVVLARGDLVTAMRASMSLPGIFAPIEEGGRLLVDGGIAENLPVEAVLAMGADVVIAVDIGARPVKRDNLSSSFAVFDQVQTLLIRTNTARSVKALRPGDVLLEPEVADIAGQEFERTADAVPRGVAAVRAAAPRLQALAMPAAEYAEWRSARSRPAFTPPVVKSVRVVEDGGLSSGFVASRLATKPGAVLDLKRLERDLDTVYGLGLYERVGYRLTPDPDGSEVRIEAHRKSWGSSYLEMGLNLSDDFKGSSAYNLAMRFTALAVNRQGGELVTDLRIGRNQLLRSELYQPLGLGTGLFIAPRLQIRRDPTQLLLPDFLSSVINVRFTAVAAGLDLGEALSNWGELRLGYERESGSVDVIGRSDVSGGSRNDGRLYLRLAADTLDSTTFPRQGIFSRVEVSRSARGLGADADYTVVSSELLKAANWGRHGLVAGVEIGSTLADATQIAPFTLGGFTRLSGLGESRLFGSDLALAKLIYFLRLNRAHSGVLDSPFYLGGTLEWGNVFLSRRDERAGNLLLHGSVFVAIDSAVGPLYLGYGRGQDNASSLFLFLGRPF